MGDSDNKVNNKLDFRNVKHTQLGGSQTDRAEYSEIQSAKRVYGTNSILKDAYTDIIMETNIDGKPTNVEYWQATFPATDKLQMSADVLGNKAGTYFTLQEYSTKKTHVFYYVVSGSGVAPGIGDIETPINIVTDDSAALIAFATNLVINTVEEFTSNKPTILTSYLEVSYDQFGDTAAIDTGTSGFMTSRLVEGESYKVGEVCISYDIDGHPVYGGNTLKGFQFNPYTASFDVGSGDVTVNLDAIISKDPVIYNVAMAVSGTEYSLTIPLGVKQIRLNVRDHRGKYTVGWTSGGTVLTKSPGSIYQREGLEIITGKDIIYFTGSKTNIIMEIETWE